MDYNSYFEDDDGLLAIDQYNYPVIRVLEELERIYEIMKNIKKKIQIIIIQQILI